MNRIVICGDTHGILDTGKILKYQESEYRLDKQDYLIICGDCGIVWDKETLDESIKFYQDFGTNVLFIDGNHDNFDLLNSYPVSDWSGGKVHKIADGIYHLIRGEIYDLFGNKFLTLGGAESTDKDYRQEYVSWWAEEEFDENNLNNALNNLQKYDNKVDFVISHAPNNELIRQLEEIFTQCGEQIPQYLENKLKPSMTSNNLQIIANKIKFNKWFCGHLHLDESVGKYCVIYDNLYNLGIDKV